MKVKYKIFLFIVLVIIILACSIYYINKPIKITNSKPFIEVYNNTTNIEDLSIYINKRVTKERVKIENSEDIRYILETINDEYIKPTKSSNRVLGAYISFTIVNDIKQSKINFVIAPFQISFGNNIYSTKNNLLDKYNEIYLKYLAIDQNS